MKPLLAVFLPLLLAYATAIQWCVDRWNAPTQYFAHCWLVPFVGAAVVWLRRRTWRLAPRAIDRRGLWLLVPALVLHLVGALLMIDSWSASSLVLAIPGASWLALGRARLAGLWPVLWLGFFLVPMPIYVEGRLAFVLKEIAVDGGAWLANGLGADVLRSADRLQPRGVDGSLFVADACGGLRSLMSMVTLAYCLAFFLGGRSWWRRSLLLLAAPAFAIVANVARIAVLCLLARHFGVPFAEGTGHSLANAAEWVTLVAALLLFDRWLPAGPAAGPAVAPAAPPAEPLAAPDGWRRIASALWIGAPLLLLLSLYRPGGDGKQRAERLPVELAGYALVPRTADEEAKFQASLPRWRELLGTGDFVWRSYRSDDEHYLHLVALFHDTNWKSVHPPRICIEGSGMDIEADDLQPVPTLGAGVQASRIVARARADGRRFVTLSVFGTADWLSGDYWDFTWHHLPRAVLRANLSGFLLRVEAPIRDDEPTAAAEARAVRFLAALVPQAREVLR